MKIVEKKKEPLNSYDLREGRVYKIETYDAEFYAMPVDDRWVDGINYDRSIEVILLDLQDGIIIIEERTNIKNIQEVDVELVITY